jgi:hypothetical protein
MMLHYDNYQPPTDLDMWTAESPMAQHRTQTAAALVPRYCNILMPISNKSRANNNQRATFSHVENNPDTMLTTSAFSVDNPSIIESYLSDEPIENLRQFKNFEVKVTTL